MIGVEVGGVEVRENIICFIQDHSKMECCVYNKKTRHAFGLRLFSICSVVRSWIVG